MEKSFSIQATSDKDVDKLLEQLSKLVDEKGLKIKVKENKTHQLVGDFFGLAQSCC